MLSSDQKKCRIYHGTMGQLRQGSHNQGPQTIFQFFSALYLQLFFNKQTENLRSSNFRTFECVPDNKGALIFVFQKPAWNHIFYRGSWFRAPNAGLHQASSGKSGTDERPDGTKHRLLQLLISHIGNFHCWWYFDKHQ